MPEDNGANDAAPVTTLTKAQVQAIVTSQLDKLELPDYGEQITKLTVELNTTRTELNAANAKITELVTTVNKLAEETESKIKKLQPPDKKKGFLDTVILPED